MIRYHLFYSGYLTNSNRLKLFQVFTFLFLSLSAYGQFELKDRQLPKTVEMSSDSLAKMDQYFHRLVDQKQLAGIQTSIIRKGQLVHFDTYGMADIDSTIALSDSSIFRIFSMTKPIVSVALMQLYEQGKFKLEDPLENHLPEFKNAQVLVDSNLIAAKNRVRIVDLLTHSSGYNYGRGPNQQLNEYYAAANLYTAKDNEEFVNKLSQIPLQFEPGTNWQYGLSTNICGRLIEVFSGQSLDRYLTDSIFTPLGMVDTHFQLPKEKVDRFTTGYRWSDEGGLYVSETYNDNRYLNELTLFNGGGGLVSTSFDYLRFCQMLLNKGSLNGHKILSPATVSLLFSDHLESVRTHQAEPLRLPLGEASFGLGFAIRGNSVDTQEQVYGWGGAVGTFFKIDLENELCYVMMIQLSPYRHLGLRQRLQDFISAAMH